MLLPLSGMQLVRTMLCLTVLVSGTGFAQSAPPLVPGEDSGARTAEPGELIPREPGEDDSEDPHLLPRLFLQPPAAFLIGGLVGYASYLPLIILASPFCDGAGLEGPDSSGCGLFLATGMALSTAAGAGIGAKAIGQILKGHGGFRATFLGALAGVVLSVGIAIASDLSDLADPTFITLMLVGPAIGATAAYAISESGPPQTTGEARRATVGLSVMPMVSGTRAGGFMAGLVGRF